MEDFFSYGHVELTHWITQLWYINFLCKRERVEEDRKGRGCFNVISLLFVKYICMIYSWNSSVRILYLNAKIKSHVLT